MGYNISALPNYTDQQSRVFVTKSILEADTIKLLTDAGSFDPTAKGNQAIQLLDTDVYFQDGTACGRNALGGANFSQATLSVKDLKVNQNYCVRDLEKTYAVEDLKAKMKGQVYTDMLFLEDIGNLNATKTSYALEQLIWQGDTTITGTTNLNMADGLLKSIKGGSYINLSAVTSGSSVTAKLQGVFAGMPIEVSSKPDFKILIGKDTWNAYQAEIAAKNLFNPNDPKTLWGTDAKLEVVNGLNGTNYVVACRLRNLQAGGEMTNVSFQKHYSFETEQVYLDSRFSLGVVAVYPQEIGLVKIA